MKLVLLSFAFLISFSAKAELTSALRPEVSFPAGIEISQRDDVKLSDLVSVSNGSDELLAILDGITVKQKETFSAKEISGLIKFEMENNETLQKINPAFKIPSEMKIKTAATAISKSEVERRIVNILKSKCHECEYKVMIQKTPSPATGPWEIDYSALSGKGAFLISVKDTDARSLKWIAGNIKVSRPIPVASRFIQSGERLTEKDVKMQLSDVTFAKDNTLQISDLAGQILQRSLQPEAPIWSGDLKREAAAKRGQSVRAIVGNEDFEISTQLQAEENGFVGDTIKLKSLENQKVLSGVIVEKGVVKIQ